MMNYLFKMKKVAVCLLAVLLIGACTTQKKKGELTKVQKFYHNVTSEYNGYFNADILYEESKLALNNQGLDNYNKILPVYKYTEADNPTEVANDLDEAIKKVSVVVSLHRESDWVDDCYLLMGKAQFLKQDYESAQEALEYMVAEFNPEAVAKKKSRKKKKAAKGKGKNKSKKQNKKEIEKKKKDRQKSTAKKKKERQKEIKQRKKDRAKGKKTPSKPKLSNEEKMQLAKAEEDRKKAEAEEKERLAEEEAEVKPEEPKDNYFLKHRPCYQEGVLWLAKTYVERDNYLGAERLFDELANDPHTFKDVKKELAPARAYFYLEQKKYEQAVSPLQNAIEFAEDKNEKARYAFILAQIHQKADRNAEALASFELAKKYSNNYEMEFSATLNVLKNAWSSGRITEDKVIGDLEKMLKESKNSEYQDQIYFVLADIAIRAGNKTKAIEYLAQSLETNSLNQAQKGESHIMLADLYYEDEQYVKAKENFDAALGAISKNDERYPRIERLANSLTDIAKNIEIIALQDSLLTVSEMSDKDKRKLAGELKRKEAEAKLAAAKAANAPAANGKFPTANVPVNIGGTGRGIGGVSSNWFAYNEKSLKKGKREFNKQWPGRVSLEDNWRRSNRQSLSINDDIADASSYEGSLTDEEVTALLAGVPVTAADKQKANDQLMSAMFELGTLYRDRLKNNPKAVETLENLNTRYPASRHELESWYFLYLAYSDLGDNRKKKEYFDKILGKYENTVYARVLKDPDYLSKTQDKESKVNEYYNETYAMFTSGKYTEVKQRIQDVNTRFGGNNSHQPRFALLDAMSTGAIEGGGGKEAYVKKLKELIGNFPNTSEEKSAKEILRLLGDESVLQAGLLDEGNMEKANSIFRVEEDKVHYGIVIFDEKVDLTKVKASISDYNRKNHKLDRLRISNIYLGSDTNKPVIIIRKFKNKEVSLKYYRGVTSNLKDFMKVKTGFDIFVVNQYNYRQVLREKNVDNYRLFFAENYLKGE